MSNLHARTAHGANFTSKKALRDALAAGDPVYFTDTSLFANRGTLTLAQLTPGDVVVGPDPYRDRRWYGAVAFQGRSLILTVK